ncbi:hypothetical protein [Streptomyces sp. NBC_01304]|uniref:hypothetical protein n=1 Tax=Streptomyces sp. NBC_01304 TaxID=2903818 RepID=UPI002E1508F0|nr:hypothetical protein OG430_06810 [Streptomyces sp. NBC_01304]
MTEAQQPARRPDPQEPMSLSEPRRPTRLPEPGTALPPGERDKLQLRLQHAVNGFVDAPRLAVEEADALLGELITTVGQILGERHAVLRESDPNPPDPRELWGSPLGAPLTGPGAAC